MHTQDAAAGEAISPAVGTYSAVFAAGLLALLPSNLHNLATTSREGEARSAAAAAALSGTGLSELLMMSHHPAITAGVRRRGATWLLAARRLPGMEAVLKGAPRQRGMGGLNWGAWTKLMGATHSCQVLTGL